MQEKIGRYEIRRELGRGGMAIVYLAYDPRVKRQVAIKVLPRQLTIDPTYLARFEQEAQLIGTLEHRAIVPVYDYGEYQDAPYLVMRYMSGGSLRDRLRGNPLPLEAIAPIFNALAPALDYAHQSGIVHRDLKPANILFDEDGHPYLADFGLARLADASQTLSRVGTPAYISPEQVTRSGKIDARADIYALGVMLYELLAGEEPYPAETDTQKMMAHVLEPVPDILKANPDLPSLAQEIIEKTMAKDRQARYRSAGELATAVKTLLLSEAAASEAKARKIDLAVKGKVPIGAVPEAAVEDLPGTQAARVKEAEKVFTAPTKPPRNAALGDTWVRPADGMVMLYVPAGSFPMGSEEGRENEKPVHEVSLDAFWIDQTAVTNAQFAAFVQATGYQTTAEKKGSSRVYTGQKWDSLKGASWRLPRGPGSDLDGLEDHPVVHVSWSDAAAYCEWAGARLPTEAEWEYAARGPEGRRYPWGAQEPDCDLVQFSKCGGRTVPAASLPEGASWVGALNMAGNVWEWVNDWYDGKYYASSPGRNPQGPDSGVFKVLRGGSWYSVAIYLRSALRLYYYYPDFRFDYLGFRCVLSPGK